MSHAPLSVPERILRAAKEAKGPRSFVTAIDWRGRGLLMGAMQAREVPRRYGEIQISKRVADALRAASARIVGPATEDNVRELVAALPAPEYWHLRETLEARA